MTHPAPEVEHTLLDADQAIPVRVVRDVQEKSVAAELASFSTYPAPGANFAGTEGAFRLLAQDRYRHKATIIITGTANNGIVIGKQGQVSNKQGAYLVAGTSITYDGESEVWAIPQATNGAVGITVIEERYAGPHS